MKKLLLYVGILAACLVTGSYQLQAQVTAVAPTVTYVDNGTSLDVSISIAFDAGVNVEWIDGINVIIGAVNVSDGDYPAGGSGFGESPYTATLNFAYPPGYMPGDPISGSINWVSDGWNDALGAVDGTIETGTEAFTATCTAGCAAMGACTPINILGCESITTNSADGASLMSVNACGFSTPGGEILYSYTAPVSGVYTLNITSVPVSGYLDYFFKDDALGCDATGWTCIADNSAIGTDPFTLTGGVTYYILVDDENTAATTHVWNIIPPSVTVASSNDLSCTAASSTLSITNPDFASGFTFLWSTVDGTLSGSTTDATATAIAPGTYTLTATSTVNGCIFTGSVVVGGTLPPVAAGATICVGGTGSLTSSTVCGPAFTTSATTINGAWVTATDPAGPRQNSSTNSSACSYSATSRSYVATQFQVSMTGDYVFTMANNTNYDGMGYIFTSPFVVGTCGAGFVRGDDDDGTGNEPVLGGTAGDGAMTLTVGTTYTLISTTFGASADNPFTWDVSGPGTLLLPSPGTLDWYTTATGGTLIGSGSPFNPVGVAGSPLADTNTPGTTAFYAACSADPTCRVLANFVINRPAAPTASVTVQPTCLAPTGTITVTAPVPATGVTYTVTGTVPAVAAQTNTLGEFTGLAPGTYEVITTVDGCVSTATTLVVSPAPVVPAAPTASVTDQPTCTVGTGIITVTVPPVTPGVTYTVTGTSPVVAPQTNTTGVFSGLAPGNYDVTVSALGCTSLATSLTVNAQPASPAIPVASLTTAPTCAVPSGTITVSTPAPTAGLTYILSPGGTTNATGEFAGLAPGIYTVVADLNGCQSAASASVSFTAPTGCGGCPTAPTMTLSYTDGPYCSNNAIVQQPTLSTITIDGVLDASGRWGGPVESSDDMAGLAGVNVNDLYVTSDADYIYFGATLNSAATWQSWGFAINTIDGQGGSQEAWTYPIVYGHSELPDFVIKGHLGNGGAPYAELRQATGPNFGTQVATLPAADYSGTSTNMVEVRILKSQLGNPSNVDVQFYISGDNQVEHATFDAVPNDEVATSWNQTTTLDTYSSDIAVNGSYSATPAGITVDAATGVFTPSATTPGTYTISYTIPSSNGCPAQTASTMVTVTALPTATIAYAGSPYCINAAAVLPTLTGTSGGTYSSTTGLTINAATGEITPSSSTAGTYSVTYTIPASGGCAAVMATTSVTILPAPAEPTASVTVQPTCTTASGTITVTAPAAGAGVSYTLAGIAPVVLPVTNSTGVFAGLAPGSYGVVATVNGCISTPNINLVVLPQPLTPAVPTVSATQPTCTVATGTITVTAPAPTAGLMFTLNPGAVTNATGLFTGLVAGDYTVVSNQNGCTSAPASMTINPQPATPAAPIAAAAQTFCIVPVPTLANLVATGTNIQWYAFGSGGGALPTTTPLMNGVVYFASQTNAAGCESTTRTAVTVELNADCFTGGQGTVGTTGLPTGFIAVDPCSCNNDSDPVTQDNGTFDEYIVVTGPSGAIITGTATGGTPSTLIFTEVITGPGMSTYTSNIFTHVDNIGYNANLFAQIGIAGTPFAIGSIGNKCLYPNVVIDPIGPFTNCEGQNMLTLEATVTPDIEGAFTWSGMFISEDGVLSFDPQLPVGNLAINLSFEATFEGNISLDGGITAANPGCIQVAAPSNIVITECCDVNPGVTITKTAGAIQYDQCANPDELISEITIRLTNTSGALLSNVYLDEIIGAVPAGSFLGLASYPDGMTTNATVAPAFNYNWNGTTNTALFANTSGVLGIDEYIEVTLPLRFNATLLGGVVCIPNAASGGGTWMNVGSLCLASSDNNACTASCGYPTFTTMPANLTVNACTSYDSEIQHWLTAVAGSVINHQCRTVEIICNDYCAPHAWQYLDNCSQNATLPVKFTVKYTDGSTFVFCATINKVDPQVVSFLTPPQDLQLNCSSTNLAAQVQAWINNNGGGIAQLCEGYIFNSNNYTGALPANCNSSVPVTFTITNECGLSTSATANISLIDNTPPTFTFVPASVTVACDAATPAFGTATATDACSSVTVTSSDVTTGTACTGLTTTRTFTATDACGNIAMASQSITKAADTAAPTFTAVPSNTTFACGGTPSLGNATATDACSSVTVTFVDSQGAGNCAGPSTIRTFTATDGCGNAAAATQVSTPEVDAVPPTIGALTEVIEIVCGDAVVFESPTTSDNCTTVTLTHTDEVNGDVCAGIMNIRRWTATDACGNTATAKQTVWQIGDTTDPEYVNMLEDEAVYFCGETPDYDGVSAVDGCGGDVSVTYEIDYDYEDNCHDGYGYYSKVRYTAVDACGNENHQTITSHFVPTGNRMAFMYKPQDKTVSCSEAYTFDALHPKVVSYDGAISSVTFEDVANLTPCGSGTVTRRWTATDVVGNQAIAEQTVTILADTELPTMVLSSNTVVVNCASEIVVEQPLVSDNCASTSEITVTYTDVFVENTVARTWSAQDACGNVANATQIYVILDTQAPVFTTALQNKTISCDAVVVFDNAIAEDACSAVTLTHEDTQAAITCGVAHTRTWTAVDALGHEATIAQTITVVDNTAPVFSFVPSNASVATAAEVNFGTPQAADNCQNVLLSYTDQQTAPICGNTGYTVTRTWVANDGCNNQAVAAQQISVALDAEAPVFTNTLQDKVVDCGGSMLFDAPTATDNSGSFELTYVDVQSTPSCGNSGYTMTRVYAVTDACNNAAQIAQTITITEDTEAPVFIGSVNDIEMTYATFNAWVPVPMAAADNCQAVEVLVGTPVQVDECNYTVDYTATDACGNFVIRTQNIKLTDCLVLGTNEGVLSSVSIYPNPVETELSIVLSSEVDLKNITAQVFDMTGKQVLLTQVTQHLNSINVNALASGSYTLRLTTDGAVKSVKFVKM